MFENSGKKRLSMNGKAPILPRGILKILEKQEKILDVGFGTGWLTNYVSKKAYVGISYSQTEVTHIRKAGYKAYCLNLEEKSLPFKDNTFSCIFASHIIEHFEKSKLITIMKELSRVLKKNGIIILTTPTEYSFGFYGEWTHIRPYNHTSLPNMLADFGFKKVDWTYPALSIFPKILQRYGRFPLFFLKPILWKEVIAWGYK